jgi:hypothetical protein
VVLASNAHVFIRFGSVLFNANVTFSMHMSFALGTRQHLVLREMSVSLAAEWTTQTLVALLVATVADRVVEVPP